MFDRGLYELIVLRSAEKAIQLRMLLHTMHPVGVAMMYPVTGSKGIAIGFQW
jgi:hypothetical protein